MYKIRKISLIDSGESNKWIKQKIQNDYFQLQKKNHVCPIFGIMGIVLEKLGSSKPSLEN